jgi:hypothetical protein
VIGRDLLQEQFPESTGLQLITRRLTYTSHTKGLHKQFT